MHVYPKTTSSTPILNISDCGSKISIANAYIDFSGPTTYNNTVSVVCNDGYDITGPSYLTCLADGTWSQATSCHIKSMLNCQQEAMESNDSCHHI